MERNQFSYFSKNCNIPCTYVLSLDNGDTITNPYGIVNAFNNYFASIAETTKKSIKYSHKHFSDYLSNESSSTIFLQPTDKEEIANIISSLNSNKASGPNSIPYRISFLLKIMIFQSNWQIYLTSLFFFCFYQNDIHMFTNNIYDIKTIKIKETYKTQQKQICVIIAYHKH